jgi:hypothetical protein
MRDSEGHGEISLVHETRACTQRLLGLVLHIERSQAISILFADSSEAEDFYFYRLQLYLEPVDPSSPCARMSRLYNLRGSGIESLDDADSHGQTEESVGSSPPSLIQGEDSIYSGIKRSRRRSDSSGATIRVPKRYRPTESLCTKEAPDDISGKRDIDSEFLKLMME